MSKWDYVRFLPITQSEVIAQKVNYRQEKSLETQLRSIEKAEKYSKSLLEKRNSTMKHSINTRMRNHFALQQGCLKYSNSDKDGETYVTLNRSTKHAGVDDTKLQQLMPRLTVQQPSNQANFTHRRLTRSSSDSSASQNSSKGQLPKSRSLDLIDSGGNRRRRSSSISSYYSSCDTRIAWEAPSNNLTSSSSIDNSIKEFLKADDSLPKLSIPSRHKQQQLEIPAPIQQQQQHNQLRRTRSLPNTSIFSTSPSKTKLSSLIEVNPQEEDDSREDSDNSNNRRHSTNSYTSNNKNSIIANNIVVNDKKLFSEGNYDKMLISSDKRVPSRRLIPRPAWDEIEDNISQTLRKPSARSSLRPTKSSD